MSSPRAFTTIKDPPTDTDGSALTLTNGLSITFDVNDPDNLVSQQNILIFPQGVRESTPVTRGRQTIILLITGIAGNTVTATVIDVPTGRTIAYGDVVDGFTAALSGNFTVSSTVPPATTAINQNLWTIVFNTNASSTYVRAHYINASIVPSALGGALDSLAVYANHESGNFSTTLRAITATTFQNLTGNTIASTKGVEAGPFCYAGTITTAVSFDAVNDITGGAITTYIGLRIRAHVGTTAPVTNIAIDSIEGENRFVGNVIIGEDSSPIAPLYIRGTGTPNGGVSSVIRLESNHTLSGNGQGVQTLLISGGTLAKGAFTGLTYAAVRVVHPAVSGAGTIDTAIAVSLDIPTIGTNNYYFAFGTADNTDPTAGGGAATGRLKVNVAGTTRYVPYY